MNTKRSPDLRVKRIYDEPAGDDGRRVLVDRVWPRGLSKDKAKLDDWLKDITPSDSLRKWFGHDPDKWEAFRERYAKELDEKPELVERLRAMAAEGRVTLLFAAKDTERNNAIALRDHLLNGA